MKIHSLIIICIFASMSQQILDYSGYETGWHCSGTSQSPIDFPLDPSVYTDGRNYLKLVNTSYPIISGYNLQVYNQNTYGMNFITSAGTLDALFYGSTTMRFDLTSINIHMGAEHTFGGNRYEMEIQFVHLKNQAWILSQGITDPDPNNLYLNIAVLFELNMNVANNALLDHFNIYDSSPVNNLDINPFINLYGDYFYYRGSFTTPSCDQDVNWIVMRNPQIISFRQLYALNNWIQHLYPHRRIYRDTQPLNTRPLYYINRNARKFLN